MSRSYWDTPLLPFINMDHVQLKRSRSNDALDRSFKRSKPYPTDSPNICISTKTEGPVMQATHRPLTSYENINGLLNSVHIERFGDPEVRESWWQQQDIEMTDDNSNTEYSSMNSVLRQAFLHRRQS
ncbi:hypothetical protein INT48_000693 [Thamnidium elegans]|uniref:Uncharacterized protein n=1 Tax=Thamnidium elegans TaxID=101142 RepID=A0A8H7SX82_9FUNG|nr:hypothetical protein INT48_000693 [Thamnidium elegans]